MLAVQMANRVKADTGVRIQLMTLASQTLAQIAAELPAVAKTVDRLRRAHRRQPEGHAAGCRSGRAVVTAAVPASGPKANTWMHAMRRSAAATDMPEIFYFGRPRRALLGLRHPPLVEQRARDAMLVCAPLLQEGIRCQRALWSLAETLAAAGVEVLRFDWFGSGDSAGDSTGIVMPGLVDDIASAETFMASSASSPRPRLFGLRSAALPLLAHASQRGEPVDVVLWAPALDGHALAAAWREQHRRQLHGAGRFLSAQVASGDDELLGFVLDRSLLDDLGGIAGTRLPAARGKPADARAMAGIAGRRGLRGRAARGRGDGRASRTRWRRRTGLGRSRPVRDRSFSRGVP